MKRPNPKPIKFETRTMRRNRRIRTAKLAAVGFLASAGVGVASLWVWPPTPAIGPSSSSFAEVQSLMGNTGLAMEDARKLLAERKKILATRDPAQPRMALCGEGQRVSCVVDGDTIWLRGEKIRVADIDTPEVGEPQCDAEYQLGMQATYRLRDLLNEAPWSVKSIGNRDADQYGRSLRVLTRAGQSIGDMLVSEGLARTWTGSREPWC